MVSDVKTHGARGGDQGGRRAKETGKTRRDIGYSGTHLPEGRREARSGMGEDSFGWQWRYLGECKLVRFALVKE